MKISGIRIAQVLVLLLIALAGIGTMLLLAAQPAENLDTITDAAPYPGLEGLIVKGEVVLIEGDVEIVEDPSSSKKDAYLVMQQLYVAKQIGDQAIQFHVNERTQVEGDVRVGDLVEVLASGNGDALSIKKSE